MLRLAAAILLATLALAGRTDAEAAAHARYYPGDSVRFVLRDGSRCEGTFVDLGRAPLEEYRERYEDWRRGASGDSTLPEIGTEVELGTRQIIGAGTFNFCGLGQDGIEVRKGEGDLRTVEYHRFTSMRMEGRRRIPVSRLQQAATRGAPLMTTFAVRSGTHVRAVRYDEVATIASGSGAATIEIPQASFTGTKSPWMISAVQFATFSAADPSDQGEVAQGVFWHVAPSFATPRYGVDFAAGLITDKVNHEGGALVLDFGFTVSIPVGWRLGIAPRMCLGVLAGPGVGVLTETVGGGAMVRFNRSFGLRADYAYQRFAGDGYGYNGFSSVYVGPYFGY